MDEPSTRAEAPQEPEFLVIGPPSPRARVEAWSLALASQGISSRAARHEGGWVVVVASVDGRRAAETVSAYETENRPDRAAPTVVMAPRWTAGVGVAVALGLGAFHLLIAQLAPALGWPRLGWRERGLARGSAMLEQGAWERAITALTLHADALHALSNTAAGALFFSLCCRLLGPGVGMALVLASGALGNATNVWLRGVGYAGLGASTAVFGAVGLLAGLQAGRTMRGVRARWPAWLPVAAGLGLLALLGASPETDVMAHLLGFVWGAILGGLAALGPFRPASERVQWTAGAAAAASLLLAWYLALGGRPG